MLNICCDSHALKGIAISWKRAKLKAFVKGLIESILLSIAIIGGMVLFQWDIMKVSSEVSKLSDGRIVYHLKLSDGYGLDRAKFVMDETGDFYWTPLRPIIKTKSKLDMGLQNTYNTFGEIEKHYYREKYGANAEIKALYIGTSDDPVLVWKRVWRYHQQAMKLKLTLLICINTIRSSEDSGIVLKKRKRSLLPSDFNLFWGYTIKKSEGNSDRKDNPLS